jgi:CDP-4-dehydro-6-deoxyglucose reductase
MKHRVTLMPSGHAFDVEEGRGILAAGLAAGNAMPYGCRIGMCRSCRGTVLEGAVDTGDVHPAYLSDEDRAAGVALLCKASPRSNVVIAVDELPPLEPPREHLGLVRRVHRPNPDITLVDLRLPLHQPMRFAAGQYIDVLLEGGARRSYSIANAASVAGGVDLQLHIKRLPGGIFTGHVFSSLKERDKIRFEGPHGTFVLRGESSGRPLLFVATCTGYAPIRSLILRALELDRSRPLTLYWGGTRKRDLYALDEPRRWADEHPNFRFVPALTRPDPGDDWNGRHGYIQHVVGEDLPDLSEYEVYAAGAPRMIDSARDDFVTHRGLPAERFFSDAFINLSHSVAHPADAHAPNPPEKSHAHH